MKMKLLSTLIGIIAMTVAKADLLYWQISDYDSSATSLTATDGWDYAKIYETVSGSKPGTALTNADGTDKYARVPNTAYNYASQYSYSGNKTASSFYIELYDNANNIVGWSHVVDVSKLADFVSSGVNFKEFNTAQNPLQFTAVPEPTSGLMLLVGMAMLGLRRRKVA